MTTITTTEQSTLDLFKAVKQVIKQQENYRPRNYQTIGGMWTVDTWVKEGIFFQVMDEGWFEVIKYEDKEIFASWGIKDSIGYKNCYEADFIEFANDFVKK